MRRKYNYKKEEKQPPGTTIRGRKRLAQRKKGEEGGRCERGGKLEIESGRSRERERAWEMTRKIAGKDWEQGEKDQGKRDRVKGAEFRSGCDRDTVYAKDLQKSC